jgi:hypothetical protein
MKTRIVSKLLSKSRLLELVLLRSNHDLDVLVFISDKLLEPFGGDIIDVDATGDHFLHALEFA